MQLIGSIRWFSVSLLISSTSLLAQSQNTTNIYLGILQSPVDKDTIVRFYDKPALRDHFNYPLVFRVMSDSDNRDEMNSAPLRVEGITSYITLQEMKNLVATMVRLINMPTQTSHREVLGAYEFLPGTVGMDSVIIYSKGAARGIIASDKICDELKSLNSAITTPRASWEFELFRLHCACLVPGFNNSKY